MMSRIDSRHWKFSTGRHFQNGHHNTAKIQHCPISSTFDMWVDNDVLNWFPTLKTFYWSPFNIFNQSRRRTQWYVFWKWRPLDIYRCLESIQDVEIGQCWICAVLWRPFWKWRPVEIFLCQKSIWDIIIYPHIKFWWYRTMLNYRAPFA
jgi:hypothetical protein